MTMIRVLIVDDHPLVRRGLSAEIRLEPDLEVAGVAADAVQQASRLQPDVVLLDLGLPMETAAT